MAIHFGTIPQALCRTFDATPDELAGDFEHMPERLRPWVFTAEQEAGIKEATRDMVVGNERFVPLEVSPDAPCTVYGTPNGVLVFMPGPSGHGWVVLYNRATRTSGVNLPLVLQYGDRAGRMVVFPKLETAALVGVAHWMDGSKSAPALRDRCWWSPFLPFSMAGTFEVPNTEPVNIGHAHGKAGKPVVKEVMSERDKAERGIRQLGGALH